jgi:hypothetical protein
MAATTEVTATTVEAPAPMEAAATGEVTATRETTGSAYKAVTTADVTTASANVAMADIAAPDVAATVTVDRVPAIAPSTTITPPAVVPRAGTHEHAADKPVRAIVAIRSTGVRGIGIVAIGANRRGRVVGIRSRVVRVGSRISGVGRNSDSDTERNLRARLSGGHQHDAEHSQQRQIFEKPHLRTSWAQPHQPDYKALSGTHC